MSYYIVHKDNPDEAVRVCRNSRAANFILSTMDDDYMVTRSVKRIVPRIVEIEKYQSLAR